MGATRPLIRDPGADAFPCPVCGANPGEPCAEASLPGDTPVVHEARVALAASHAANLEQEARVGRLVSPQERRDAMLRAMMLAPVRALGLIERVPPVAKARGWLPDGDKGYALIVAALAAYKIGCIGQRFRVPAAYLEHADWRELVIVHGESPTARQIVEAFYELRRLLEI